MDRTLSQAAGIFGATQSAEITKKIADAGRRLLKTLGQTIKLVSLYQVSHPVPASAIQESWHLLQDICAETGWRELTFGIKDNRWLMNELMIADQARAFEILMIAFQSHGIHTTTFSCDILLHELSAFCELASTPPNRLYETDASDYLRQRGVKHVRIDVESFVRAREGGEGGEKKISPIPEIQLTKPRRQKGTKGAGTGSSGSKNGTGRLTAESESAGGQPPQAPRGFGAFIKGLVENAVQDPRERAQIYAEAVRQVEQALARRVSEATKKLTLEKQHVLNERIRTETVLAKVADGKVVVDSEGRVLMMDPTAEQIVGKQLSEVAGKSILEHVNPSEQMLALSKDLTLPDNTTPTGDVEVAGEDEVLNTMRKSMALVQTQEGRLVGTYAVIPYVTKLREAIKLQEEFVSNVTHDLKAPLTSICAALEVLAEKLGKKMDPDEANFLDISIRNSRVLKQMISEILDFSKIRSGKMTIRPGPVGIEPVIQEAVNALSPWAQSKRISLESSAEENLPNVHADAGRVTQILTNLISNAIKFTDESGRIWVSARRGTGDKDRMVVISVKDNGCGISTDGQKRLFERFSQVSDGKSKQEGVGLGLTIAKELVTLHAGDLWLESAPGKGSTFHFSLPIA